MNTIPSENYIINRAKVIFGIALETFYLPNGECMNHLDFGKGDVNLPFLFHMAITKAEFEENNSSFDDFFQTVINSMSWTQGEKDAFMHIFEKQIPPFSRALIVDFYINQLSQKFYKQYCLIFRSNDLPDSLNSIKIKYQMMSNHVS
jgi:hypothetical protein